MNKKEQAINLVNRFYMILFFSDSDKGEECLVSILATECAIACAEEMNDKELVIEIEKLM